MEPIDTRSLQKNTKTNSIEISSQKKIGRVKKRKFFMRPFSYKYNSSYISQKSV